MAIAPVKTLVHTVFDHLMNEEVQESEIQEKIPADIFQNYIKYKKAHSYATFYIKTSIFQIPQFKIECPLPNNVNVLLDMAKKEATKLCIDLIIEKSASRGKNLSHEEASRIVASGSRYQYSFNAITLSKNHCSPMFGSLKSYKVKVGGEYHARLLRPCDFPKRSS